METAKAFLLSEVAKEIGLVRKVFFEIIEDIKASDSDNFADLVNILGDEDLAKKFVIFQENRNKAIRKKILDSVGDLGRNFSDILEGYKVEFDENIEFKGIIK